MSGACKIFVSYSFSDDYPSGKIQDGWVSSFVLYLHEMLKQVIKNTQFHFYLEHAPHLTQDLIYEREKNLKDAHILLVILSKKYLESRASISLVENYIAAKQADENYKIFKVLKYPILQSSIPTQLRNLVGFPFHSIDKETGQAKEIQDHFDNTAKSAFWLPLTDLCFEIKKYTEDNANLLLQRNKEKYVFLAHTGADLELERAVIKRELERRNYQVLPNRNLAEESALLKHHILEDLKKSMVAIHLVGSRTGAKPLDSEDSFVEIQNEVAAEYSAQEKKRDFRRLIWIASEEKNIEEKQKFYIERLQRDKTLQLGADILQTELEDFKSAILNYLATQLKDNSFKVSVERKRLGKCIYLVTDKRDIEHAQPIAHYLAEIGFEVMISSFDRKKANSRRTHQDLLNKCDIACVLFFDAKKEWLTAKLQDILKSAGMGRKVPFEKQIIFTNNPQLPDFLETLTFLKNFAMEFDVIISETDSDFNEIEEFFKGKETGITTPDMI